MKRIRFWLSGKIMEFALLVRPKGLAPGAIPYKPRSGSLLDQDRSYNRTDEAMAQFNTKAFHPPLRPSEILRRRRGRRTGTPLSSDTETGTGARLSE